MATLEDYQTLAIGANSLTGACTTVVGMEGIVANATRRGPEQCVVCMTGQNRPTTSSLAFRFILHQRRLEDEFDANDFLSNGLHLGSVPKHN